MASALNDRRVMVVEDDGLVAETLSAVLAEEGLKIVGPATRVRRALDLIGSNEIDVAVLDYHLDGETAFPIADALKEKNIPFIFTTVYVDEIHLMKRRYPHVIVCRKPFELAALEAELIRVLE
jgi:CheY-like chemotaxis protein